MRICLQCEAVVAGIQPEAIIEGLYGQDKDARRRARDELRRAVEGALSENEAIGLIAASKEPDRFENFWHGNAQNELIWAFYNHAKEQYIQSLLDGSPSYGQCEIGSA